MSTWLPPTDTRLLHSAGPAATRPERRTPGWDLLSSYQTVSGQIKIWQERDTMKHKRPPTNGKDMQIKTICKLLPKKTGKKTFPKEYLLPDAVVHSRQFSLTAVAMCRAHLP